jgi:hypothetical protein
MRTFLYRAGGALFAAAAMVGLFTVLGAPLSLREQITSALASGIAVQIFLEWSSRRPRPPAR